MQGVLRQPVAFQAETTAADSGGGFRCSITTPPVDAVVSGWHVVVPELVLTACSHTLASSTQHVCVTSLRGFALSLCLVDVAFKTSQHCGRATDAPALHVTGPTQAHGICALLTQRTHAQTSTAGGPDKKTAQHAAALAALAQLQGKLRIKVPLID